MLKQSISVCRYNILFLCAHLVISPVYAENQAGAHGKEPWEKYFLSPAEPALNRLYDVLHYDINLLLQPDHFGIEGKNTILLTPRTDNLNQLSFDLEELQVDSVRQNHAPVSFTHRNGELIFTVSRILNRGDTVTFDIYYHGVPQRGLYRRINSYGDTVVYSHSEPYDARYWFPCNDDPADKATHDLRVTMPESYKVVSNGTLQAIDPGSQGWSTTHWQENYPIATYLISLATARYQVLEKSWTPDGQNMPVMYYVYPQDVIRGSKALDATVDMLTFFSDYIGLYPFNLEKYAMVEVPFAEASAMENQTATTMRDVIMDNEEIIAHELAHQWWGDAVTPASFADIWLNEGFASYFDALFTEYRYGETEFNRRMENYRSLIYQDGSLSYPIYNPPANYLFGRAVYFKGAWILHMLRSQLGDDTFREICRQYFERFAYKNVTTSEFIQVCEQVGQEHLETFFNQWLNYGGVPDIYISWNQDQQVVNLTLQQTQTEIVYQLDLELEIRGFSRDSLVRVVCDQQISKVQLTFNEPVAAVVVDPEKKILLKDNSPVYYLAKKTALVSVHPNPARSQLSVVYETDRNQEVTLEIWNILGEQVRVLSEKKQNAGLYRYDWGEIDLSSGTYFCVLRAGEQTDVKKVVILR